MPSLVIESKTELYDMINCLGRKVMLNFMVLLHHL